MAEAPSPCPPPELTQEEIERIEANRLRALAKRKASSVFHQNQPPLPPPPSSNLQQHSIDYWRNFKARKICNSSTKNEPPSSPQKRFCVRLEICAPDSFSIVPLPIEGFPFPGQDHCFAVLQECLSNVMLTHYTQIHGSGEASVYKIRDHDAVLRCLKSLKDIDIEDIPWNTYNVIEKLSHSYISGRWTPCRPEHLSDEMVEELTKKLPRKLLNTLLPFQLEGLKFGLQRGGRCLIADEMGLGKTLQAIAIASCFANEDSILVVCPAILRYSWAEELERWLPSYLPSDIHLVFGSKDNPMRLKTRPKIVVISFTMLSRLRTDMLRQAWGVMIIDESHHVRCSKKQREPREIQSVLDVSSRAKHIILLSGTPSLSRPFDIYHQINMLWPGLLGKDKLEFAKTYCCPKLVQPTTGKAFMDYSKGIRLEELNVLLKQTVMIRRLKEHLLVQLPPKRRQILRLSLKKSDIILAKNCVAQLREDLPTTVDDGTDDATGNNHELSDQVLGISKVFGFLEWLSLHPIITEADESSNIQATISSHKMIIFAHHLMVLDKLQAFLCNKHIGFVRIDGSVHDCDRQASVRSFQSSKEVKIAIIGIKVGYAGLDLSVAQNVVFLELPKDPTSLLQAEDRAHRRGQTNAVNIYIFCAKDTSDESRWRRLNRSMQRVSSTVNGKYDAIREIEVDNVSCIGNMSVYQSMKSSDAAPSLRDYPTDDKVLQAEADYDVDAKADIKVDATQVLKMDTPEYEALAQNVAQVNLDSLRFAVSQYTERVHLCTYDDEGDSLLRSLSQNFRPEEISADPSERASVFIKENPACHHAILRFIKEWKSLNRIDQRKLYGKPLQLPLAIELLRLSESSNHDKNGLLKGGSMRRHTPLCEIIYPQNCNSVWKLVRLCDVSKKKKLYLQNWSMMDEPLCRLCKNPCIGINSKKPKNFFDLFCNMACYEIYCSTTSGTFLRKELFQIERGICTNCQLDCHKLVQHLKPLTVEDREKYIKHVAPLLANRKILLDKLVREPTEGNAWHADHIVPVYLGGGECKIENIRTLCVACHADVTALQRTHWCMIKKILRKAMAKSKKRPKLKKCSSTINENTESSTQKKENADDDRHLFISVPGSKISEMMDTDNAMEPAEASRDLL